MITKTLHKKLHSAIAGYIKAFEKKHEMEFCFWIGDEVGGIACIESDWYFTFQDICLDLETNQPKHRILDWSEENCSNFVDTDKEISYKEWLLEKGYISYESDNPHEEANFKINIVL